MSKWNETQEAAEWIGTADSRETSTEIMGALAFFARNKAEAEALWNGDGFGTVCHPTDIWERVTGNGLRDPSEFAWGSAGTQWWEHIRDA